MRSLLATLSALGIRLEERDGKLHVNAPSGAMTPELREEISRNKEALLAKLQSARFSGSALDLPRVVPDPDSLYEPFPLNDVQHAYWVGRTGQLELGDVSSHVYFEFECAALDPDRLNDAFGKVLRLHDMLRAVIDLNGRQRILDDVPGYEIDVCDLRGAEPHERQRELARIRAELSRQEFACDRWPLFDIRLVQLSDSVSHLCVSWDFLVIDAWSMSIIFRQWHGFYQDPGYTVSPPGLSFRDYVLAESQLKELPVYRESKEFWWSRIDELPAAPRLPQAHGRERKGGTEFHRRRFRLPARSWTALRSRAGASGLTPSSLLLASFSEVLRRWSASPHYCLNLTLFNRLPVHEDVGDLVGDFTNLMVLEVDGRAGDRFVDRALNLQNQFLTDFDHRHVSAVEVMRELAKRRGLQNQAIFPVVFTSTLMLDGRRNEGAGGWERFGPLVHGISQTPQVFLDCQIFEIEGDLVVNWDAVDDVFLPGVLDDMFSAQCRLLESLASTPELWEQDDVVPLPESQREVRRAVDDSAAEIVDECLHVPFVERALEHPDDVAVVDGAQRIRYATLLAHAELSAAQLREKGVEPNQLVAVVMRKGWEQVAAVLGVLLSGAAYLPIDPRWPARRRHEILEQGAVRVVLTTSELLEELEWPGAVECLTVTRRDELVPPTGAPPVRQSPGDLAYVIFTSGSTGVPKGVMIEHRSAMNTVAHVNRLFEVGRDDKVLAVSDLTFDLSVYDIFGLLAVGGTVVFPAAELARDPGHWEELIRKHRVTIWNSAPPLMGVLADALDSGSGGDVSSLRLVLLSGDWIPVHLPDRVTARSKGARVVSLGGATEGSIWSIYHPIDSVDPTWESIPYGRALPNQHMYVLDDKLRPCPDWVTGDIYIGGRGVAAGYWRDPERTGEQFLEHPRTGQRIYATGDKGRFRPDGEIEFLGREDSQIKLRGHRVELGEIAACLQSHPGVRNAVAQVVGRDGRSSLVAYVVAETSEESELFERVAVDVDRIRRATDAIARSGARSSRETDLAALKKFSSFWTKVQEVCVRAMLETVQELDLVDGSDLSERLGRLQADGRIQPARRRLIQRWLRLLTEEGYLRARGSSYEIAGSALADADPMETQLAGLESLYGDDPSLRGFLEHVAGSLRNLRGFLSGDVNPLEVLFPESSWDRAEALYETNPVVRHHNGVIASVVRSMVEAWEPDRVLRVLELGAGTGGTTGSVLAELPPERTEYWYTDLSTYFFEGAKEKFADYPFVRYGLFDIDENSASQGHQPHSYDLIVAANVLHNAQDVDVVLGRLRELLTPAGYLLLLEGTRTSPWQWATVAPLEAVESYTDQRAESDVPILTERAWSSALVRGRFEEVHAFPVAGDDGGGELLELLGAMPQHVIVARAPAAVERFRPERLTAHVRERLPEYMVPQRYVLLESFPLTANGKVDLRALPEAIASQDHQERRVVSPRSDTESQILEIWKEVLGVDRLSITDNFFEVGGDSLLMTSVLRKLNQLRESPLSIADLFSYPTIQSLAEYLSPTAGAPKSEPIRRPAPSRRGAGAATGDLAVVGMAGRFPDAAGVGELWDNIAAGKCSIRKFTDEELLEAGVSPEELARDSYVKAGPVLDDMEMFDASYFGYTPREAQIMDPQQRFLLECAVEALENAGYPNERHGGPIGVFVGKGTSFYLLEHVLPHPEIVRSLGMMPVLNVNEKDHAATILSYKLDLTGPSVNVNTGCSTSLVAVHSACRSLLAGECDIALAGAVSFVTTRKRSGYLHHEGEITSPDGLCRAFANDANGTVFGSGVGLVVLKPLAAAMRDRDTIHAIIKGTAINNDGSLKAGYTAPSQHGQAHVIATALDRAGVEPETIELLEAHGTGTNLGDPIEFGALRQVFGGPRSNGSHCALGSVKTNIGHLDSAAGIAGLIKVIEALKHRKIPPTLHASVPSDKIDLEASPFYLSTELADWNGGEGPRRAGVSSFGVGGTNAHVVVEEAPAVDEQPEMKGPQILPLSAMTDQSLRWGMERLAEALERRPGLPIGDVAYTLQTGRNAHLYRSFVVSEGIGEAAEALRKGERLPVWTHDEARSPSVSFLFPGQGAQRHGVTRTLYETQPAFRSALDQCADLVQLYADEDIRSWLYGGSGDRPAEDGAGEAEHGIDQTAIAQPVLFSVEYALVRFWESLGIRSAAMLGHSLGEYVAACVAGVFSLEEALSLVVARGRLLQRLEPGRMLAVSCGEEELRKLGGDGAWSLAAVNGPSRCVVSGPGDEIDALEDRLESEGISARALRTSRAFHSAMVEPVLETFERCVAAVERSAPQIPFLSNVTGTWITPEQATSPAYWARHMRETVRFSEGVEELVRKEGTILLEVGPGRTLASLAGRTGVPRDRIVSTFGQEGGGRGERRSVLESIGRLWGQGIDVDWSQLHAGRTPRRVPLPSYAFVRERYWIERNGQPVADDGAAPAPSQQRSAAQPLGAHSRPELGTDYAPPGNETEAKLVEIWQRYLGIEGIGIRDNFFDLGGDSLVATRVHAQIKEDLGVELPAGKMFDFVTIRRIYLYIAMSEDPSVIDSLSEEELDDFLQVMES